MLQFQSPFFQKKTLVGPQYHNENRFTKISIVRFKRIYECILRSTSLTLIRKVCYVSKPTRANWQYLLSEFRALLCLSSAQYYAQYVLCTILLPTVV